MDLDSYQHYFYDYDCGDDFYLSTAPSEDIWKKFELVPSPPMSPLWGLDPSAGDPALGISSLDPWPGGGTGDEAESRGHSKGSGRNYASIIRRDCMWSGFSARERLEKAVSDRLAASASRGNPSRAPAAPDCVPSLEAAVNPAPAPSCPQSEPKTQGCSGSESPSDSEGDEIDVVTVEKRQSPDVRKPVTITVRADPLDPCMKHFHISIHQQQHNYAARFPPESCSQEGASEKKPQEESLERDAPEEKEDQMQEEIMSPPPVEREAPPPYHPKSVIPDSEDMTKRKNHNFLERKRRNDLRSRFLALRDQVPSLASCSKAPKVVILSKALEYLQSLVSTEKRMIAEKRQLRCQQQQLQKRIAYLSGY